MHTLIYAHLKLAKHLANLNENKTTSIANEKTLAEENEQKMY